MAPKSQTAYRAIDLNSSTTRAVNFFVRLFMSSKIEFTKRSATAITRRARRTATAMGTVTSALGHAMIAKYVWSSAGRVRIAPRTATATAAA